MANNNRIEETLNSLNQLKRIEADPYLFEKIKLKLEKNDQPFSRWHKISWGLSFMIIIALNLWCTNRWIKEDKKAQHEATVSMLAQELQLTTSYSY